MKGLKKGTVASLLRIYLYPRRDSLLATPFCERCVLYETRCNYSRFQDADVLLDVKVSVWDWDKFNDDDHMGDALMTVNPSGMSV